MKTKLLLPFLFITLFSHAQKTANTSKENYVFYTTKEFDSIFNIEPVNDFQFRFVIDPPTIISSRIITLFVMTRENEKWHARLFHHTYFPEDKYWEVSVDTSKLGILWKSLEEQNILKMKKAYLVKTKSGKVAHTRVMDGIVYWFSFSTKKVRTSCMYISPEVNAAEFPKVREFRQVTAIIKLISKYCSL